MAKRLRVVGAFWFGAFRLPRLAEWIELGLEENTLCAAALRDE
jgi:hypothetical protein